MPIHNFDNWKMKIWLLKIAVAPLVISTAVTTAYLKERKMNVLFITFISGRNLS